MNLFVTTIAVGLAEFDYYLECVVSDFEEVAVPAFLIRWNVHAISDRLEQARDFPVSICMKYCPLQKGSVTPGVTLGAESVTAGVTVVQQLRSVR
jgi:hypothetical protein